VDLPAGVYWQWRRWCTTHGFYLADIGRSLPMPNWTALQGKAKFVAISDDGHVPPAAVWRLMQHYPEAVKSQLTLRPEVFGLKSIGHIAAFSPRNAVLWPQIIA
jgi:predicted alpha/beta hydrolase